MSTPQSRFCANCGFPALPHDVNCSNCGRALAGAAPPPPVGPTPSSSSPFGGVTGLPSVGSTDPTVTPGSVLPPSQPMSGMPPATGMKPPRSGMPGWVIGLIACLVVGPVLLGIVGIIAAIAIPNMTKFANRSATAGAKENLDAIWTAEVLYQAGHGKYSSFTITPTSQSDAGFTALAVTLPHELQHNIVGAYDENGKTFWIVATVSPGAPANAKDCWELSSDSPTPVHTYDGVADKQLVEPKAPVEIAAMSMLGAGDSGGDPGGALAGLTGAGGGGSGDDDAGPGGHGLADDPTVAEPDQAQASAILATDTKSETAKPNLEAIFAREKAWKAAHHSWLAFDEGNAGVWAKLGVKLPQAANHTYSAKVDGGALVLTAEGNLDDDPFEDLWQVDPATGVAVQEKSDALNLDLTSVDKLFTAQAGGGDDE